MISDIRFQISKAQIRKIHALKNRLGWSDAEYREFLMTHGDGFATSCKDLSQKEAERLIRKMEQMAVERGVWKNLSFYGSVKYEELGKRPGMATPKQIRMIEAMWKDVSRKRTEASRARALRAFLRRIVGVNDLRFLEGWQVKKVIKALEEMLLKKKKEV